MNYETTFSPCRKYRYTLWRKVPVTFTFEERKWAGPYVQFIGLNPSTADETINDPTIRRCINFASQWGFTQMCMTNLFAFRATDPVVMKAQQRPIGVDNTNQIREVAEEAGLIIAAWGKHGLFCDRQAQVLDALTPWIEKVHHLGLNSDGTPRHPLYLPKTTMPTRWITPTQGTK